MQPHANRAGALPQSNKCINTDRGRCCLRGAALMAAESKRRPVQLELQPLMPAAVMRSSRAPHPHLLAGEQEAHAAPGGLHVRVVRGAEQERGQATSARHLLDGLRTREGCSRATFRVQTGAHPLHGGKGACTRGACPRLLGWSTFACTPSLQSMACCRMGAWQQRTAATSGAAASANPEERHHSGYPGPARMVALP